MKRNLNVLLAVLNAYKEDDFTHFSSTELNQKFGFAKRMLGNVKRIRTTSQDRKSYYKWVL